MKNILVVEDEANAARAVAARLTAEGNLVSAVHSAWEALNVARQRRFDLFILDIGLPDRDGLSLAVQLLALPGAQNTPVLFLTGQAGMASRLLASKLGVCLWVDKPYRPEDLRSAVAMALENADSHRHRGRQFSPLRPLYEKTDRPTSTSVLVIEDDKRLALGLQLRLESVGYKVGVAHSGQAGLNAAIESPPSLVISDIYMPGGLGFTIFEQLATHDLSGIPVIFLTASERPNLRDTAMRSGAADFLEKPCDPAKLLRSVRRAISARP